MNNMCKDVIPLIPIIVLGRKWFQIESQNETDPYGPAQARGNRFLQQPG